MDVIIKDVTVIDESGAPGFQADIGLKNDCIEIVGQLSDVPSAAVMKAGGKVICPGFIDIHSHSDYHLLINPQSESKVRQGVTTEVGGNCGYAAAPIGNQELEERRGHYKKNSASNWTGRLCPNTASTWKKPKYPSITHL